MELTQARTGDINVVVLHNDKEGLKIGQLLKIVPFVHPIILAAADELKSSVNASCPHLAIVGKWSVESRVHEIIQWVRRTRPQVKLLAHATQPEDIVPAFLAGANGYIYQNDLDCVGEGVEKIMENGFYIPAEHSRLFIDRLIETGRLYQSFLNAGITPREVEVIRMQILEKTRFLAARRMGVEVETVKSHNRIILRKLGMRRMKDVIKMFGPCLDGEPPPTLNLKALK